MPIYNTQSGVFNASTGLPPHAGIPLRTHGPAVPDARIVLILLHGRGAGADGILPIAEELQMDDVLFIVPEASGRVWYPFSFLSPVEANEPGLSSALSIIDGLTIEAERAGITPDRISLLGFSQGACLALEYAARHPKRYHSIIGLSGGLIGPPGTRWKPPVRFDGTPVFLGCSDRDPHIPAQRVEETAAVFEGSGAVVEWRLYPGMPHTINDEELDHVRRLLTN